MKIKKKEYREKINDSYWDGVNAGMKFALNNPEEAKKFVDKSEALRKISEAAMEALKPLSKAINNFFNK